MHLILIIHVYTYMYNIYLLRVLCCKTLRDKIKFLNIEGGSVLEFGYKGEGIISRSGRVGQVISTIQKQKRYRKIRFRDSFWKHLCLAWTTNYICSFTLCRLLAEADQHKGIFVYAFCWPIANVAMQFIAQPLIAFPLFSFFFYFWRQHWPCLAGWTCRKNAFYLKYDEWSTPRYARQVKVVDKSESRVWEMTCIR